jgi:uncharacterized protein YecT (DUF1311 family)
MKLWLTLLFIMISPTLALADESPEFVSIEKASFLEFHDPGYMLLKLEDGSKTTGDFHYKFISYEEISTWSEGEAITIVYSPQQGLGIIRNIDGLFYKVILSTRLLDTLEKSCLDAAPDTVSIVMCYRDTAARFDVEYNMLLPHLLKGASQEYSKAINEYQRSWGNYKDSFLAVRRVHGEENGGTIRAIEAASANAGLSQQRTKAIQSLF